ncbi:hypothetical protein DV737_g5360, partial [Chaetothyriales sp. CBS 132003]
MNAKSPTADIEAQLSTNPPDGLVTCTPDPVTCTPATNNTSPEKPDWSTPSSTERPYSGFTVPQKRAIALAASAAAFFSPLTGSIYFPALTTIANDLGVSAAKINLTFGSRYPHPFFLSLVQIAGFSDNVGRRPAYFLCFAIYAVANLALSLQNSYLALLTLRMLQSAGSSGTVALAQGMVADITTPAERGSYLSFVSAPAMLGPSLSPIIGGLIAQNLDWHWIFWFLLILSLAFAIPFLLFLPETGRKVVGDGSVRPPWPNMNLTDYYRHRARQRRGQVPDDNLVQELRKNYKFSPPNPIPTFLILFDLESTILLLVTGLLLSCFYAISTGASYSFSTVYGFNDIQASFVPPPPSSCLWLTAVPLKVGLMFVPLGVGGIISAFTTARVVDANFMRWCRKCGIQANKRVRQDLSNFPIERARLEVFLPFLFIGMLATIAYGWMLSYNISLAGPVIIMFVMGWALIAANQALSALMVDIWPATAAIEPMSAAISRGWAYTLLALLAPECEAEPGLTNKQLFLTNHDLKPVEPERRQWKHLNFVTFWIADSFNINTWMIAASSLTDGLSWWQAWICVWVGYTLAAFFVCLTGRIGATYHIGFPVVNRASFGIWGALWPVLNRAVMACIWYGVQGWIGGECIYLMIASVWPSFGTRPTLTASIAMGGTVNYLIAFILFWLGSLPFLWFPVHKIRHLFTVKSIVAPIGGISLFIWCIVRAGGVGPIVHQGSTAKGSKLAWAVIAGIMSALSNFATLIVNVPDFARFASRPSAAMWPQALTIPLGFGLTSFIGIIAGSASAVIYPGKGPTWNPLDLMKSFITNGGEGVASAGDRAGVFLIAASFVVAQLGTNIAANSISAGTDLTALLPRFINIRRGSYICAIVGICICPWQFLTSASNFTTYLSAYSVFLSSIAGPMITDYYFVRKGYLQVRDLYNGENDGPYYGVVGIQWRGYVAYICGILINIVGFVGAVGAKVPIGATYIYRLDFFTGFMVSSIVYYLLCQLFPVPAPSPTGSWFEVSDEARNPNLMYAEDGEDTEQIITGHVSSKKTAESSREKKFWRIRQLL